MLFFLLRELARSFPHSMAEVHSAMELHSLCICQRDIIVTELSGASSMVLFYQQSSFKNCSREIIQGAAGDRQQRKVTVDNSPRHAVLLYASGPAMLMMSGC